MSFKFNPFTGNFDLVGGESITEGNNNNPFRGYSRYSLGSIANLEEDNYNLIDCCSLPIINTRSIIDLGDMSDLCY